MIFQHFKRASIKKKPGVKTHSLKSSFEEPFDTTEMLSRQRTNPFQIVAAKQREAAVVKNCFLVEKGMQSAGENSLQNQ